MVKYSLALSLVAVAAPGILAKEKQHHEEHRNLGGASPTYWPTYWPTYSPTDGGDKTVGHHIDELKETRSSYSSPPPKVDSWGPPPKPEWGAPPAPLWDDDGWSSSSKSGKGKTWGCSSSKGSKVREVSRQLYTHLKRLGAPETYDLIT
jgi:hypothetical protein